MPCKAQMVALILAFGLAACQDQVDIAAPLTTAASRVASLDEGGSGSMQLAAVPATMVTNAEVTFEATLTPASAGHMIIFRFRPSGVPAGTGSLIGGAVTDASGVARQTMVFEVAPGSYFYDASFAPGGSSPLLVASATLTVLDRQATEIRVMPMTVVTGERATFEAKLTPAVAGRQIAFRIRSGGPGHVVRAVTNASGVARITAAVKETPGSYFYDAAFGGDASYWPSFASAPLDVTRIPTELTAESFFGPPYNNLILRSTILPKAAGKAIEFRLDGVLLTTIQTDQNGMASIGVRPVWAPGTVLKLTYRFKGDDRYGESTQTQSVVVPAPDGDL